jgi:phosphate transport system permease protein
MSDQIKPIGPQPPRPPEPDRPGLGSAMAAGAGVSIEPLPVRPEDLTLHWSSPRTLFNLALTVIAGGMTILALVPLASVLFRLIVEGGSRLSFTLFTELPPAAGMDGGGIGNALLGTLLIVGLASLISVPTGILAAVFLSEFGPETRVAAAVRFCAKVLTGLPSVLAGLFAYAAVVLATGVYSAPAAGLALAILMLPTVILTAEQALHMVPVRMKEAAVGMGATPTQVTLHIVLPTAMPAILTGVMLAVARAAGETAPLLFTALFSDYWLTTNLMEPTPSLAVLIYDFSSSPFRNQLEVAWAASLVLVALVLIANIVAQTSARRSGK